jgi:hypothetical protein
MLFAEKRFPLGQNIKIIDPFLKQALDMSIIIRVDNISEVEIEV